MTGGTDNRDGGTGPIGADSGPAEDRYLLEALAAACLPEGRQMEKGAFPRHSLRGAGVSISSLVSLRDGT